MPTTFSTRVRLAAVLLFAATAVATHAREIILFGWTNSWRYNQTTSYDGVNWTAPGFNDSALPTGRGVLAREDSGNPTVVAMTNTVLTLGRTTYYFRTRFNFTESKRGIQLVFSNLVDDGAVFYLNGVEVKRVYVPNTVPILYSTLSTNHEAALESFTLSGPIVETNLVQGTNVLAVEVHQTTSGSTDVVMGLALSARTTLTPEPLNLPLTPPTFGFTTVDAFPGLTFGQPLCIVTPPGETNRIFVLSKGGQMYAITNLAAPNLSTVMSLAGRVFTGSESGLLGLALHPGFATNRYFYLFYSVTTNSPLSNFTNALHQRVSRFQMTSTNNNVALQNSELVLISQVDPAGNHNGGDLHFGDDGYLYISLGDGGVQYDGSRNSQTITSNYFSAILRIDVDKRPGNLLPNPHGANSTNYFVPADNPWIGATNFDGVTINPNNVRTEFWAVGFRNPWRMSFDRVNGFLYCGDVGQDTWEEISVLTKGGNYGWAYLEGLHPGYRASNTVVGPFIPPIQEYRHGSGPEQGNSVTGGVVYRGSRYPELYGWYIFADYVSGNVWKMFYDGTNTIPFQRLTGRGGVAAFGTDPANGDVLLAGTSSGIIFRLVQDTNNLQGTPLPPTLAQTGAFTNLHSLTNSTQALTASSGMTAYDVNVPLWSDNAEKARWFRGGTNFPITFSGEGNWSFPEGMTWVKHFDIEITNGVPESKRRLETRFLVKNESGGYGITYRWTSPTNAALVPDGGLDESLTIYDGGIARTQVWHYPARSECLSCHSPAGGFAVGFNTAQLNLDFGTNGNQIEALSRAGYFTQPVTNVHQYRALASVTNEAVSREWRVRSYIASQCAMCHVPGGAAVSSWSAAVSNSTALSGIINGTLNNNLGNADARVIAPGSLTNSMLLTRIATRGTLQMPPLGTSVVDEKAVALLSAWITNDIAGGWTNTIAPFSISLRSTNGAAAVEFTQQANRAFRVETATNLNAPVAWHFINTPENRPTYPASNTAASVTDPGTNATQRFYRVRQSAP